jgi:hypothetical protein
MFLNLLLVAISSFILFSLKDQKEDHNLILNSSVDLRTCDKYAIDFKTQL